jgi:integrase
MNFLTVKKVERLLCQGNPGRHFDGQGLYLITKSHKSAHWERRYELNKRAHWIGLGSAFAFNLAEARERNRSISQQLADGIDPLAKKRTDLAARAAAAVRARTFRECAEEYVQRHQSEWRSARHGQQWRQSLAEYVFPKIGDLDVATIDKSLVLGVLEQHRAGETNHSERKAGKFWEVRTSTADRVRNRIELVLNFAMAKGYRPEGSNPAAWVGLKEILASPTRSAPIVHHAAVPYVEMPGLLSEMGKHQGSSTNALDFLILTAARTNEVLGAKWAEIDFDSKTWTIPAARMKSHREHKVPLSPRAIELLKSLPTEKGNPFIFLGQRQQSLSPASLQGAMRRLGRIETVHGFRSSFSDWAHERTAFSNHVIELSLAHTVGSDVEKAYRRSDLFVKRRKLMQAWAAFCTKPASSGDVVHLRTVRA